MLLRLACRTLELAANGAPATQKLHQACLKLFQTTENIITEQRVDQIQVNQGSSNIHGNPLLGPNHDASLEQAWQSITGLSDLDSLWRGPGNECDRTT